MTNTSIPDAVFERDRLVEVFSRRLQPVLSSAANPLAIHALTDRTDLTVIPASIYRAVVFSPFPNFRLDLQYHTNDATSLDAFVYVPRGACPDLNLGRDMFDALAQAANDVRGALGCVKVHLRAPKSDVVDYLADLPPVVNIRDVNLASEYIAPIRNP